MVKFSPGHINPTQPLASSGSSTPAQKKVAAHNERQQNLYMASALSLTWQLMVIVLVPIVGGYVLDRIFSTAPWLTLVGIGIATAGMILTLKQLANIDTGERS